MTDQRDKLASLVHTLQTQRLEDLLREQHPLLFEGSQVPYPNRGIRRWMLHICTPFDRLPEEEKARLRRSADQILSLLEGAANV